MQTNSLPLKLSKFVKGLGNIFGNDQQIFGELTIFKKYY